MNIGCTTTDKGEKYRYARHLLAEFVKDVKNDHPKMMLEGQIENSPFFL
jgi:hypothetical protein